MAADFPNRAASDYSLAETSAGWGEPVPRQQQTASPRKIEAGGRQASEMPSWRSEAVWDSRESFSLAHWTSDIIAGLAVGAQ